MFIILWMLWILWIYYLEKILVLTFLNFSTTAIIVLSKISNTFQWRALFLLKLIWLITSIIWARDNGFVCGQEHTLDCLVFIFFADIWIFFLVSTHPHSHISKGSCFDIWIFIFGYSFGYLGLDIRFLILPLIFFFLIILTNYTPVTLARTSSWM